jgi:hypothetical protein
MSLLSLPISYDKNREQNKAAFRAAFVLPQANSLRLNILISKSFTLKNLGGQEFPALLFSRICRKPAGGGGIHNWLTIRATLVSNESVKIRANPCSKVLVLTLVRPMTSWHDGPIGR